MFLPIDPSSGLPVYRQIMEQVRRMVVAGRLAAGEKLPSVRDLAVTLGINPLTVGKAYGELERLGVVEMRRGLGVFALAPRDEVAHARGEVPPGVGAAARRLVLEAAQAGLTLPQTARAVESEWRDVRPRPAITERKHR
ncbi:MAG TPA: GntR family transcriptional regulator [Polyangia bacterium]|jgi:GntR family transcriptional regulator|nr:GntR family transcriptional regulator [Polyangia bacterium]